MAQDKEKIKELSKKIKDLQLVIDQKNTQLNDYQDIERIADEKIRGLNNIHAEKIRSLMNSVQNLKKENAALGKQTKEHKRSEFIQQLNKEIGEQDTVIEILRKVIGDEKRADNAVIQELSKGPARIRVPTREELKIEIKDLKTKLMKYEKKKGGQTNAAEEEVNKEDFPQNSMLSLKNVGETKPKSGNAEYILKINELNNEIEDLNLLVSGKQTEIDKYKQLLSKKNQEIIELTQAKIDLKFMVYKNEELKSEIESLKQRINTDIYVNYDQEIKLGELELANTVHKNLQNKANENVKLEIEAMQTRLGEVLSQNKQLTVTTTKLKDETQHMKTLLEDAKERNRKLSSEHEAQMNKLNTYIKEKDTELKSIKSKLTDYENKFDQMNIDIKDKETIIADLETRVSELEEKLESQTGRSAGGQEVDVHSHQAYQELEHKKQELELELNHLKQELFRFKERTKELIKSEIELADKVDILEQENRLLSKKVIAANLIARENYSDTVTKEEMHKQLKDLAIRYEAKIKEISVKLSELEIRNKDLEDIRNIMNSAPSLNDSYALTETENGTLTDKI